MLGLGSAGAAVGGVDPALLQKHGAGFRVAVNLDVPVVLIVAARDCNVQIGFEDADCRGFSAKAAQCLGLDLEDGELRTAEAAAFGDQGACLRADRKSTRQN